MNDPIAPLIDALHGQGRLRVWSLVITVFGDLVQYRGGEISTARLGALLGRVGVEQGTLRTALSRLGQDGWVTSERRGRTSLYRLSAEGQGQFAPATSRIYAAPRTGPVKHWALSLRLTPGGAEPVLVPADEAAPDADLTVTGAIARITPAWRDQVLGGGHRAALAALAVDLDTLAAAQIADPLDAAAARMLLIHRWRRIVLRHPEIAPELMPADTPLGDPRAGVAQAYARLSPAAEQWLDSGEGDLAPMPPASPAFARRFSP